MICATVGAFIVTRDFKMSVMSAVIVGFLLTPTIATAAFVFAYMKLSSSRFATPFLALAIAPIFVFLMVLTSFKLSVVPDALHVNVMTYSQEESWGFGPGGNEAGIRTFQLPKQVANEIERRGIEFFNNMPPNRTRRDWRGIYGEWRQTPISNWWKTNEKTGLLDIYDYICAYGFCIDVAPTIVKEANEIINSEGSYYAYGRTGLIIVCPAKRLVLYLYNG
jgi:hypothetical protein